MVEITLEWLLARVREDDGCLIWTLTILRGDEPRGAIAGNMRSVRRAVWSAMHGGRKLGTGYLAQTRCKTPGCVHPDHVIAVPKSQILKGREKTLSHRAKIAAAKRAAMSPLTIEAVREMRASEKIQEQLAKEYGVTQQTVNKVLHHKQWRDYTSPFAGLAP